jgi:Animal haem peroxidase
MADTLRDRVGTFLSERREWFELPRLLGALRLVEIRNELREKNLHDTEEPPLARQEIPADLDPQLRNERTCDGTYNDLHYPKMGCAGARFGRNIPLAHAWPDTANLMNPSPRLVSRELMTRDQFKPATILNLLAAPWIQFMVHDWFVHKRSAPEEGVDIALPQGDAWPGGRMRIPKSVPEPAPAGSTRPPAYANLNSHWWDGSQIYGCEAAAARSLRSGVDGKFKVLESGLLPVDETTGIDQTGFSDNWWLGLGLLHTLFTREHNHICDELKKQPGQWSDDKLYGTARLINSALMAKIHTVEWSTAILPNYLTSLGLRTNWFGYAGEEAQEFLRFINENELLGGVIGSDTDHHTAPYSLTEEFAAVYRMHPLLPDEITFRSAKTGDVLETKTLPELSGRKARPVAERVSMADLLYSFGVAHPGAITLHNYPAFLQDHLRDNGERFDLAAVDVFRDRERGVPRYNQFRRLLNKRPVRSFDELTDNPEWRKQLKAVYDDNIEMVDTMTGLFAEPLPQGMGFSDTAFRVFLLMASRRLKSDRFFTSDWGPALYTEFGVDYVKRNGMADVLKRHVPEVASAFAHLDNPFKPWKALSARAPEGPPPGPPDELNPRDWWRVD